MRKTNFKSILLRSLGMLFILAVVFTACKEDEPAPAKQKADFATSATSISEDAGAASTVTINFDKALTSDSELSITLVNSTGVEYSNHYVTNPNGSTGTITLEVAKGANSASFTVTPVDDTAENDARVITMTLASATGSLEIGTATVHTFTITDNDVPASVNFKDATSIVTENSGSAHTIELTLTSAAINAGTFDVAIVSNDAAYTTDFTTDPDGSSGSFTVSVAQDATTASFTVTPVDNSSVEDDKKITFSISNGMGGVNIGQSTSHELTITEDDNPTTKTIAEIRALYDGSADVSLSENWTIEGTVISNKDAVTGKNIFIQDATAGIVVRWDENHSFDQGDNMTINVMGAKITDFNDLVQITDAMPLSNGTVNSSGNTVAAEAVTFEQLNTGDYQGKLVKVQNVSFASADGLETVSGSNTANDGATDATVRVESYAPFSGDFLPIGSGIVQGVAGVFSGTAQLLPQTASDLFDSSPTSTISLFGEVTFDFGSVETNVSSASQTFGVSGSSLAEDITITAPQPFEVSLEAAAAFGSSIIVTKAAAEAGQVAVYIRFSPTSGFANTFDGLVVSATSGAASKTVSVTGTETPVGGGTSLLFADDFDYGSAAGDLTAVSGGVWNAHSGAGSGPAAYISTSLSMSGYGSSGVGGSFTNDVANSEDVNAAYSEQTSGTLYGATLINLTEATTNGDYFFHFKDASFGLYGRVYVKDDGSGNLLFGIREGSGSNDGGAASIVYGTNTYAKNTTYVLVVKYDFTAGSASIYVLDNAAATEPATPEATIDDADNATTLSTIGFRQGSNTPTGNFDGVRVATDWAGVIGN